MATYKKITAPDGSKIQVESAIRDGEGKNISNNYAKQTGFYDTLGAGYSKVAKQVENVSENSGNTQTAPFLFQATATANNTSRTPTAPVAKQAEIRGNSVVVNQLIQNGDFADASKISPSNSDKVLVSVADNVLTYTLKGISITRYNIDYRVSLNSNRIRIYNGHKYLIVADINTSHRFHFHFGDGDSAYVETLNQWVHYMSIVTVGQDYVDIVAGQFYPCGFWSQNGWEANDSIQFKNYGVVDLTKWFGGNDKIPSDILDTPYNFYKHYQGSFEYNAGTLATANATALKTIGRNQFDYANPTEYIRVVPDQNYAIENAGGGAISEYTADKTLIKTTNVNDLPLTEDTNALPHIVIGKDTAFVKITGYTATTCFYLYWNGQRTGYEEYVAHEYALGSDVLRSCPAACDVKSPDGTIKRRVGVRAYASGDESDTDVLTDGTNTYYPLTTLTTEQGTAFAENIEVDDYGTMEYNCTNGIPQGNKFFYPADYVLLMDDLNNFTEGDVTALAKKSELTSGLAAKQNTLTFDSAPTENSDNPVKSGGVYSALINTCIAPKDTSVKYRVTFSDGCKISITAANSAPSGQTNELKIYDGTTVKKTQTLSRDDIVEIAYFKQSDNKLRFSATYLHSGSAPTMFNEKDLQGTPYIEITYGGTVTVINGTGSALSAL